MKKVDPDTMQKVRALLEGSDYERDDLEAARAQADNASQMVAILYSLLIQKGVITEGEVEENWKLFGSWGRND